MSVKQAKDYTSLSTQNASSSQSHLGLVLLLLCAAQFMVALDFSIVNVALPSMQTDLGFSQDALQWVISAYAITFGSFLLLGGRASDLYGRRRLFIAGLVLFALASFAGGMSVSPVMLIIARAIQGLGAAVLAPAALSLLTTTFPEGPERNRALGIYGMMTACGFVIGVIAGGLLTQLLNWRWTLFVNVPLGVLVIVGALLLLSESRASAKGRQLDLPGALLVTLALVVLVFGLSEANNAGWFSAQTIGSLLLTIVFIVGFLAVEARVAEPIIPLSIFRRQVLILANVVNVLIIGSFVGIIFVLTLFLQHILGESPLQTGLTFIACGSVSIGAGLLAARIAARFGIITTLVGGALLQALGTGILVFLPTTGTLPVIIVGLACLGFGDVTALVMVSIQAVAGVPNTDQGLASGLVTTSQQVGSGLGLAIIATVATAWTKNLLPPSLLAHPPAWAVLDGFRFSLGVAVAMAVAAAILSLFMRSSQQTTT